MDPPKKKLAACLVLRRCLKPRPVALSITIMTNRARVSGAAPIAFAQCATGWVARTWVGACSMRRGATGVLPVGVAGETAWESWESWEADWGAWGAGAGAASGPEASGAAWAAVAFDSTVARTGADDA
eukprot:116672-Alexandrium_andersonii.AAC.1